MITFSSKNIHENYKLASRKYQSEDTVISVGDVKIGGGNFCIIAGPCAVESEDGLIKTANAVKNAGASVLRGGAFKPRTSPYSFQGLGKEGIDILVKAKKETGLPVVTELTDPHQLEYFDEIDIVQIGARNMQNFTLLKEVGRLNKPVLLKRGFCSTLREFLLSAEYILNEGNKNVILCERGIRTFEPSTRNTLDISSVPVLKSHTHLPVIVDPSHATGHSKYVEAMSLAATAAGADGLMTEVHNCPSKALSDGKQSITPEEFAILTSKIFKIRNALR